MNLISLFSYLKTPLFDLGLEKKWILAYLCLLQRLNLKSLYKMKTLFFSIFIKLNGNKLGFSLEIVIPASLCLILDSETVLNVFFYFDIGCMLLHQLGLVQARHWKIQT